MSSVVAPKNQLTGRFYTLLNFLGDDSSPLNLHHGGGSPPALYALLLFLPLVLESFEGSYNSYGMGHFGANNCLVYRSNKAFKSTIFLAKVSDY